MSGLMTYKELKKMIYPNSLTIYDVGEKIRLGSKNDGGYIVPTKGLENSVALFSYGIFNDISFDEDYIKLSNLTKNAYGYDHTIEGIETKYPDNFTLYLEGISSSKTSVTDNFLSHYKKLKVKGKVVLKIDVEGAEFEYFENTDIEEIANKVSCLVIEFHDLDKEEYRNRFFNIIDKLNWYFYLCHAHGNNCSPTFKIQFNEEEYDFPSVIELTYVSKDIVKDVSFSISRLPSEIDNPNTTVYKDIELSYLTKGLKTYTQLKSQAASSSNGIPKIVFRTSKFEIHELPKELYDIYELDIKNNPGYDFYYFNDEDCRKMILDTQNENWIKTYDDLLPTAFKADFWRYVVLYLYGGIYLDSSHVPLVSYDKIIQDHKEVFLKDVTDQNGINNSFIAVTKGNEVIKKAIDLCVENVLGLKTNLRIFEFTGPQLLENAFRIVYNIDPQIQYLSAGMYSLLYKLVDHDLNNPTIDLSIYDLEDKQIIKYRAFGKDHYKWLYNDSCNVLRYNNLYSKKLIYKKSLGSRGAAIERIYRQRLLREVDPCGLMTYYLSDKTIKQIEREILGSQEYKQIKLKQF